MSTMHEFHRTCAVCGATHRYRILTSTNAFGSPDLDLRPPQMKRGTMPLWVQECPSCGYTAEDVSDPTQIPREYLLNHMVCDFAETVRWWMRNDSYSPEEVSRFFLATTLS